MKQNLQEVLQRVLVSLNTQDGRGTADPFYCVFSKREVVVDAEYGHDRIFWWHQERHVEADERTARRLDLLKEDCRKTGDWVRLAVKEIDHFETACFTEQGCKDFLEIQGHNLRKPFIYATSLFRNWEMIALREALLAGQLVTMDAYQFLAAEYGRVMLQAGFSESAEAAQQDAMGWIAKRPAIDEGAAG